MGAGSGAGEGWSSSSVSFQLGVICSLNRREKLRIHKGNLDQHVVVVNLLQGFHWDFRLIRHAERGGESKRHTGRPHPVGSSPGEDLTVHEKHVLALPTPNSQCPLVIFGDFSLVFEAQHLAPEVHWSRAFSTTYPSTSDRPKTRTSFCSSFVCAPDGASSFSVYGPLSSQCGT